MRSGSDRAEGLGSGPPSRGWLARGAGTSGFTLVELLVSLAIFTILVLIALPALQFEIYKKRLVASCSQVSTSLLLARFEALKQGIPVVAALDLDAGKLRAFLDLDDDRQLSGGERYLFDVAVPEAQGTMAFGFMGPDGVRGSNAAPAAAIVGFTEVAGQKVAVFEPDGSIDEPGAFRFGDGREPRPNVFEVRVVTRSTARIEVRKYRHADSTGFDPELGGSWFPRGGGSWTWH